MTFLYLFLLAIPIFFLIDVLWLGIIARRVYDKYIGSLLRDDTRWMSAIVFYLLYILGVIFFVVHPAHVEGWPVYKVLGYGAGLGFFAYMTYELTNYAVLKKWPWQIVIIDIIWGTVLTAGTATLTFLLATALL